MQFFHCYIVFVVVTSVYRMWVSTRIPGVKKTPGEIKAGFTATSLVTAYAGIVTASVLEYLLLRRDHLRYDVVIVGLLVYLFGLIAREWPVRTLHRFWSHHVEIRSDHQLILNGPYRYLRHPNYLCLLCEVLGFPLISNSYLSFVLAAVVYIPLLGIRIRREERALIEKFGEDYRSYIRSVPALLPRPGRTAAALAAEIEGRAAGATGIPEATAAGASLGGAT
jgi:protein-S-isoprenylcysteine O-methyltransferase Ste14